MRPLPQRWTVLVPAGPDAAAAGADLLNRWSQEHRRYHAIAHLDAVLDAVDVLAPHAPAGTDLDAVRLAAWFHDAVHEGRAGADERASAALARGVLRRLGVAPRRVEEVERLVLLTASHDPAPGDAAGAVLCDADLAVLGGPPEAYAGYVRVVREEYARVPDADFRAGRAAVLRALLALDPLYRTAEGRRRWAAAARRHQRAPLRALESTAG